MNVEPNSTSQPNTGHSPEQGPLAPQMGSTPPVSSGPESSASGTERSADTAGQPPEERRENSGQSQEQPQAAPPQQSAPRDGQEVSSTAPIEEATVIDDDDDDEAAAETAESDEAESAESLPATSSEPLEFIDESVSDSDLKFDWYILKVQVNREDSIKDALLRRVKMNGLERFFKDIVVPTEDVAEFTKTGKRRIVKKKLYPGYILVNLSVNDDSWFMVRETPGIGDFTGSSGKPTPMDPRDVERILRSSKVIADVEDPNVKTAIPFKHGDRVRVKEGYFQNFEGDVDAIDQANGRVTVMINIFGRSTPVELEHWQIELI